MAMSTNKLLGITAGGLAMALGLIGAGILYQWPDKHWLGWTFIIAGIVVFVVPTTFALGRFYEHKWMRKPSLDLTIDEAFIIPAGENTGNCFLRISLHNLSLSNTSIPPPTAYSLALAIGGKKYNDTVPLNLDDYELQHYQTTIDKDDFPGQEIHVLRFVETLDDIRDKSGDLKRDFRIYGWIGMSVRYLPPWGKDKEDKEVARMRYEYRVMIEGEEPFDDYEEVQRYIPNVRNVEELVLTVKDAHQIEWPTKTVGPFSHRDKAVVRKKSR